MRTGLLACALLLAGCAAGGSPAGGREEQYRAEIARLRAQLASETAERQRAVRREEALRRQLEAMTAAERGLLDREDRTRNQAR